MSEFVTREEYQSFEMLAKTMFGFESILAEEVKELGWVCAIRDDDVFDRHGSTIDQGGIIERRKTHLGAALVIDCFSSAAGRMIKGIIDTGQIP